MRFRLISILPAALMLAFLVPSCKEKETTKEYMNGSLNVEHDMPLYVRPGESYTFSPSGITAPDGTDVGYYFTAPITSAKDTLKDGRTSFKYTVPDSLGTFTLSCAAYPVQSGDKYYITSVTLTFAVVSDDPEHSSITGVSRVKGDTEVDIDERIYYARKSGSLTWLRSNLGSIGRDADGKEVFGHSFRNSEAMQNIFGAYYTWEEAKVACPAGWHLPSDAEWVDLLKSVGAPSDLQPLQASPSGAGKLMAKARFNGSLMWDYYREVNITDEALGAIPTGYANVSDGEYAFAGYLEYAVFWTADEYEGNGVYRYINKQYDNVFVGTAGKQTFAASVRCVR